MKKDKNLKKDILKMVDRQVSMPSFVHYRVGEADDDGSILWELWDKQTEFRLNLAGKERLMVDGRLVVLTDNDMDYSISDVAEFAGLKSYEYWIEEAIFLEKFGLAIVDWDGSRADDSGELFYEGERYVTPK